MELVTLAENTKRGGNSLKTHCLKGHPYEGDNLINYKNERRICRQCTRKTEIGQKRQNRNTIKTHCNKGHTYTDDNYK